MKVIFWTKIMSALVLLVGIHLTANSFHLAQYANIEFLLMKIHRVLNGSSKCVNVHYRKKGLFIVLPLIHNQKLKKQHIILEISTKKKSLRNLTRFHGGPFQLRNFATALLLKTVIWTWIFFQVLQSALLKNEKKSSQKDTNHLKIAWHKQETEENIEKRERKTKNEKKTINNNIFFTFTFLYSLYCYICLTVFSRGRLLEMQ